MTKTKIAKTNRGGLRSNSGRKPIADKKVNIRLYPRQSVIDKNGGEEEFKRKLEEFIETLK